MKLPARQWCLSASALLVTAATFLLASSAGAQDPCDRVADKLLEAKLYDKAQISYAQIERSAAREGTEAPECVKAGLGQIFQARAEATRHYERGQEYEKLEKPELARDEYVEAVRADPTFDEASAALDRLLQPPATSTSLEQELEVVRALDAAGLHEAAEEELKEAIKAAKPGETVPSDMKNLVRGTKSPWGQIRYAVEPWARTIAEFLIVVLLLLVLLRRFVPWLSRQRRLRLDIEDFDKGTAGLELAKALPALVEESFRKSDALGKRSRPELLTGPIDKTGSLSNIANLDPRVNLISQLIDIVVPPHVVTLAGSLQKSKVRGAGVSLTLTDGRTGRMLANESIWLEDYDPKTALVADDSKPYFDLAEPAAIWTLYSLQAERKKKKLGKKEKFALLEAENWQSYAYYRMGVRYDEDNKRAARDMYYRALASSPDNIGACLNLAILDVLDPKDEESNPRALDLLKHVKKRAQESTDEKISMRPPWYVATYQLAAAYDSQDQVRLAYTEARELVEKINNTIKNLEKKERTSWVPLDRRPKEAQKRDLLQFLNRLKPLAVIMLAALLVRKGDEAAAKQQLDAVTASERLRHRVRYNLACYHSRFGEQKEKQKLNVAREKAYKSALDGLRYAFQRERKLVEHARTDKSLRGVSKAKKGDFDKLIKQYAKPVLSQPADKPYLADLEIVGEAHAKQLKQQGIVSRDDLIAKAATPAARRRLAEKTGISLELLKRWALLADMMRVVGTDVPQVNLMVAADVDSLQALKESDPENLAMLLHQVNQARSLVKQLPELETVWNWVVKARHTRRMVNPGRFTGSRANRLQRLTR